MFDAMKAKRFALWKSVFGVAGDCKLIYSILDT